MATYATGGGEEELCSFELFECSVCLESLINKQPRLLSCGHTFCTPCLEQLSRRNTVKCPKCRSTTKLQLGGVKALAKNNDLSKMKEREKEISERIRCEYFCQMCRKKDAGKVEYFCTMCPKGLTCQSCYNKHQIIPALKSHTILPIEKTIQEEKLNETCEEHGEVLEHFCPECKEPICIVCTCDPQHEEHCDKIVDFKTGLKEEKESMNKVSRDVREYGRKIEKCVGMLKEDMDSLKESKNDLSSKCKDVESMLNLVKQLLNNITELDQPSITACEEMNTHSANVQFQITQINTLNQKSDMDFIQSAKDCLRNCDRIKSDVETDLNKAFVIHDNIKETIKKVNDVVHGTEKEMCLEDRVQVQDQVNVKFKMGKQTKSELVQQDARLAEVSESGNPHLLLDVKPGKFFVMESPLQVVSVGDGTAILIDKHLSYIQRIYYEGNIVIKYQIQNKNVKYKCASVHGGYLFVATSDNAITKMSLDGSGCTMSWEPQGLKSIKHISAIRDNVILISEEGKNGRILEYDMEAKSITQRVSDIWVAGNIGVVQSDTDTKYIVGCYMYQGLDKYIPDIETKIYNKSWNLISTLDKNPGINKMGDLQGLTVTHGGKVLIACGNTIHEYGLNGSYVKKMLDKDKLNHIQDITYSGGYLWVLEKDPFCIKIFK